MDRAGLGEIEREIDAEARETSSFSGRSRSASGRPPGLIWVRASTRRWEARMDWGRHAALDREFDCFAAEVSDPLLRTGHLMTGNANDAEDLVQKRC